MPYKLAGYAGKNTNGAFINELLQNNLLEESFVAASAALLALRAEDKGWAPINRIGEDDGFTLESLKEIAELAELQSTTNPLLKRGLTLRTANVFGRGLTFEGKISARATEIVSSPYNKSMLFSADAYQRNERALFDTGNLIMAYRKSTKKFFPIPIHDITNTASNPDLKQDVWFYQRTWTETDLETGQPKNQPTVLWYPTLEATEDLRGKQMPKKIGEHEVDLDVVIIDLKVNTRNGSVYGVPDSLPAMPYAWAHSEYIKDASKLLKALATIAWKVTSKSKANAQTAGGRIANPKNNGSTAVMTADTDIVAMPRSGQVNMKDGQSIAGYVASALEVSLIALLSDPGSASGSYGAAATLDGPTANSARARQDLWKSFYERVYRAVGIKDVIVNFPKIQEDPSYRIAQTLTLGFAGGAFFQDEYRAAMLEATDVIPMHPVTEVPDATVFTVAAKYSAEAAVIDSQQAEEKEQAAAQKAITGQGQSNGRGNSESNDLRDSDATPGTGQ